MRMAISCLLATLMLTAPSMAAEISLISSNLVPTLVLPADASAGLRTTAKDFRRCLQKMTGQEPRLAVEPEPAEPPLILLGLGQAARTHLAPDEMTAWGPETALIRTFSNGVLVCGRTELGSQHAAYLFLESLGCRWFFAGDVWEEIPRRPQVILAPTNRLQTPSFALRDIWPSWGLGHPQCQSDWNDWNRRNRMKGALVGSVGHAYAQIIEPRKEFKAHPEWFPLIDGQRRKAGQLCLSNPEVRHRAVEYAREAFRRDPRRIMVSLSPNDGAGWCQCAECKALGSVSDQTLSLANHVAENIAVEFPDHYVAMYAYAGNSAPPQIAAHPQVIIFIATAFQGNRPVSELLDGWSAKARQIAIRDYYDLIIWNRDQPRWMVSSLRHQIPLYHSRNVIGITAEAGNNWAPMGLNYYVASKLMGDVTCDVDALLDDYYAHCWHAAAPALRRYDGRWRNGERMTARLLRLSFEDLEEASAAVHDDPVANARVDLFRLYLYWQYLYRKHNSAQGAEVVATARRAMHFAWRLLETNMIHAYAQFRELRIWRLPKNFSSSELARWKLSDAPEDAAAESTGKKASKRDRKGGSSPAKPFFTHEEIDALCQAARADLPDPIPVEEREFTPDLIPITETDTPLPEIAEESRPSCRGANLFVFSVSQPGLYTLNVRTGLIRQSDATWTLFRHGEKEKLAEGQLTPPGPHELQLDLPEAGVYQIRIKAGAMAVRMGFTGPGGLVASRRQPAHVIGGVGRLYFYVPQGTPGFALQLRSPDGLVAVTIFDPEGQSALKSTGHYAAGEEFAVKVPVGMDGRVWSLSLGRCEDIEGLMLVGVPPYLSQRPEQLLIPREVGSLKESDAHGKTRIRPESGE